MRASSAAPSGPKSRGRGSSARSALVRARYSSTRAKPASPSCSRSTSPSRRPRVFTSRLSGSSSGSLAVGAAPFGHFMRGRRVSLAHPHAAGGTSRAPPAPPGAAVGRARRRGAPRRPDVRPRPGHRRQRAGAADPGARVRAGRAGADLPAALLAVRRVVLPRRRARDRHSLLPRASPPGPPGAGADAGGRRRHRGVVPEDPAPRGGARHRQRVPPAAAPPAAASCSAPARRRIRSTTCRGRTARASSSTSTRGTRRAIPTRTSRRPSRSGSTPAATGARGTRTGRPTASSSTSRRSCAGWPGSGHG